MVSHFSKWGNSLALRIPSAVARDLGIEPGAAAELTIEAGKLVIAPVPRVPDPVYDLGDLVARITDENRHEESEPAHSFEGERI